MIFWIYKLNDRILFARIVPNEMFIEWLAYADVYAKRKMKNSIYICITFFSSHQLHDIFSFLRLISG